MPAYSLRAVRKAESTGPPVHLTIHLATPCGEPPETGRSTADTVRGWTSSLALHSALLLALGLWYITPRVQRTWEIETQLAGSEMGIEDGLTTAGGLNTEFEVRTAQASAPDLAVVSLPALDVSTVGLKVMPSTGAETPSADGGFDNPNPGAGDGTGFGLGRFGAEGEVINGVAVRSGDPQFTLLWDSEADLDLHVIEPGGQEIYWESPRGRFGGELDIDNTQGFGPENIYWLREREGTGGKVKGPGPPGVYKWFVAYSGGFGGMAETTRWKVRIRHDGKVTAVTGELKTLNERSREHELLVGSEIAAAGGPALAD
jgi:hypothetical protein